jgi:hypothetical protein
MTLNFPNLSRSYDVRMRRVRFWAHDAALEVPFFVEVAALSFLNPWTADDEAGLLNTFDVNRAVIQTVAARTYARERRDSYTLKAADFA